MSRLLNLLFLFLFTSCSEKYNKVSEMKRGDVVSFIQGKEYCIAKILDIDKGDKHSLVSVFFYKKRFKNRPDSIGYINLRNNPNAEAWGNINWDIEGFEGMKPQIFYFDKLEDKEISDDTLMNKMIITIENLSEKKFE